MSIIKVNKLTKKFGRKKALSEVSFEVKAGSITGFLGPNGAGKSTTMNVLMGFMSADSGTATIFDRKVSVNDEKVRRDVGFLSNNMALDDGLTARQEIEYFGHLAGNFDEKYMERVAKKLGLTLDAKIGSLSTGNHQKVALITALMGKPKLLVLDEPTNGLDPIVQAEFNKLILELKENGSTVFISSHILSEVDELCDEFIFIRGGKIVAMKTRDEVKDTVSKTVTIGSKDATKIKKDIVEVIGKSVEFAESQSNVVKFTTVVNLMPLLNILVKYEIDDLEIGTESLEDSFMKYYEGDEENV